MFMKQEAILIAAVLAAFMFVGFVGQSHAIEITS